MSNSRYFPDQPVNFNETLMATILGYFDQRQLLQARCVNSHWKNLVDNIKNMQAILAACGLPGKLEKLTKLHGGLTNVTYRITVANHAYVARLPGKNTSYIEGVNESYNAQLASSVTINPAIHFYEESTRRQLSDYLFEPQPMSLLLLQKNNLLEQATLTLKAIHQSKRKFKNDVNIFARNRTMLGIANHHDVELPEKYALLMQGIESIIRQLNIEKIPCHNDTTPANFILSQEKMWLIDWEYSGNNYPVWDLICLAIEADFSDQQIAYMFNIYYGEIDKTNRFLFYLLQPVYAYWAALWYQVQITNKNYTDDNSPEFSERLKQEYLVKCKNLLDGERFREAHRFFLAQQQLQIATTKLGVFDNPDSDHKINKGNVELSRGFTH
ncbi:MAG: hypothetical protein A3E83_04735 [Gammaproteobacteria bacterium RIFCSPHIGHO2_12_FULL_41_20]|nr:MAG: hypothetical protein A3E83_04735 [Gammaproteobacteria bacterium RIFCSPHIGHO2_12_FULL_41_20]